MKTSISILLICITQVLTANADDGITIIKGKVQPFNQYLPVKCIPNARIEISDESNKILGLSFSDSLGRFELKVDLLDSVLYHVNIFARSSQPRILVDSFCPCSKVYTPDGYMDLYLKMQGFKLKQYRIFEMYSPMIYLTGTSTLYFRPYTDSLLFSDDTCVYNNIECIAGRLKSILKRFPAAVFNISCKVGYKEFNDSMARKRMKLTRELFTTIYGIPEKHLKYSIDGNTSILLKDPLSEDYREDADKEDIQNSYTVNIRVESL